MKQTTIDSFSMNPKRKFKRGSKRDCKIMDALARFVALDMQPITVIEGQGLSELLEPMYKIPSRKHVMQVVC